MKNHSNPKRKITSKQVVAMAGVILLVAIYTSYPVAPDILLHFNVTFLLFVVIFEMLGVFVFVVVVIFSEPPLYEA